MNSIGMSFLIEIIEQLQDADGKLVFTNLDPAVDKMLTIMGIVQIRRERKRPSTRPSVRWRREMTARHGPGVLPLAAAEALSAAVESLRTSLRQLPKTAGMPELGRPARGDRHGLPRCFGSPSSARGRGRAWEHVGGPDVAPEYLPSPPRPSVRGHARRGGAVLRSRPRDRSQAALAVLAPVGPVRRYRRRFAPSLPAPV